MSPDPTPSRDAFYVGYLPTPRSLAVFCAIVVGLAFGASAVVAVAMVTGQANWGDASFQWGEGYQTETGILQVRPYPVLYLPPGEGFPDGRAIPLAGQGKRGVQQKAEALDGAAVDAGGILLRNGDDLMLQVGGKVDLRPAEDPSALGGWAGPAPVDLGETTLKGELVEAKCYLGAMRPGRGKVHKLCANLCLIGGIPPMLVVYRPDAPPLAILVADRDGGPLPERVLGVTSAYVEVSGRLERRADLLVLHVDPDAIRRL